MSKSTEQGSSGYQEVSHGRNRSRDFFARLFAIAGISLGAVKGVSAAENPKPVDTRSGPIPYPVTNKSRSDNYYADGTVDPDLIVKNDFMDVGKGGAGSGSADQIEPREVARQVETLLANTPVLIQDDLGNLTQTNFNCMDVYSDREKFTEVISKAVNTMIDRGYSIGWFNLRENIDCIVRADQVNTSSLEDMRESLRHGKTYVFKIRNTVERSGFINDTSRVEKIPAGSFLVIQYQPEINKVGVLNLPPDDVLHKIEDAVKKLYPDLDLSGGIRFAILPGGDNIAALVNDPKEPKKSRLVVAAVPVSYLLFPDNESAGQTFFILPSGEKVNLEDFEGIDSAPSTKTGMSGKPQVAKVETPEGPDELPMSEPRDINAKNSTRPELVISDSIRASALPSVELYDDNGIPVEHRLDQIAVRDGNIVGLEGEKIIEVNVGGKWYVRAETVNQNGLNIEVNIDPAFSDKDRLQKLRSIYAGWGHKTDNFWSETDIEIRDVADLNFIKVDPSMLSSLPSYGALGTENLYALPKVYFDENGLPVAPKTGGEIVLNGLALAAQQQTGKDSNAIKSLLASGGKLSMDIPVDKSLGEAVKMGSEYTLGDKVRKKYLGNRIVFFLDAIPPVEVQPVTGDEPIFPKAFKWIAVSGDSGNGTYDTLEFHLFGEELNGLNSGPPQMFGQIGAFGEDNPNWPKKSAINNREYGDNFKEFFPPVGQDQGTKIKRYVHGPFDVN